MGRVFFPLDEELALLPGNLSPRQHGHPVHLASWMPFDRAAQMLERLLQVYSSEETVRRLTEQVEPWWKARNGASPGPWTEESPTQSEATRLALSADGAMVPLVKGEWVEARTLAIGTITAQSADSGEVEHLSYFSRVTTAETFTALAKVEVRRRQVVQVAQVCAVSDDAPWLQTFFDLHRPDAVRILDFPMQQSI